jgi:hypothetical protein
VGQGRGDSSGRSEGSGLGDPFWPSGGGAGAGPAALRGGAGAGGAVLGGGLGLGSATCPTAPMVDAASPVQTAGLGLPVVAVAVSAKRIAVAAASAIGATRSGLIPPIDFDRYRGVEVGGVIRLRATFNRHSNPGSMRWCSVLGIRTRFLF